MSKISTILSAIVLLLYLLTFPEAYAEEYDFSGDFGAYRQMVASINAVAKGAMLMNDEGLTPTMVLCKTQKVPFDISMCPVDPICVVYGPYGYCTITANGSIEAEQIIAWLKVQPEIVYAEMDHPVSGAVSNDDGASFRSWGAERMGMGDYARYTQRCGAGSAKVAVIDSGVCYHSAINPKIIGPGYDYVDVDDDPTNDLNGHGTHVAGIVADCTAAVPVYIYPIRVLDANANGSISNVACAVLQAIGAHVDIINLSLTSPYPSETLLSVIRQAVHSGITVVVAAGNYADDTANYVPACMTDSGVIVVGSVEQNGSRSSYSNYGASVDVYAYGTDIVSCSRSGGYVAMSGTSMAAPHVASIAAMMKLTHPDLSPSGIEKRVKKAAESDINVASAGNLFPRNMGFSLWQICMDKQDCISMPTTAYPITAEETIFYKSNTPSVVSVSGGKLQAHAVGEAMITAQCWGLQSVTFMVKVTDDEHIRLQLPGSLTEIPEAVFQNDVAITHVVIQNGVTRIGKETFSECSALKTIQIPSTVIQFEENCIPDAVILCEEASTAHQYAIDRKIQYVVIDNQLYP